MDPFNHKKIKTKSSIDPARGRELESGIANGPNPTARNGS
jgi:hypothetical protein